MESRFLVNPFSPEKHCAFTLWIKLARRKWRCSIIWYVLVCFSPCLWIIKWTRFPRINNSPYQRTQEWNTHSLVSIDCHEAAYQRIFQQHVIKWISIIQIALSEIYFTLSKYNERKWYMLSVYRLFLKHQQPWTVGMLFRIFDMLIYDKLLSVYRFSKAGVIVIPPYNLYPLKLNVSSGPWCDTKCRGMVHRTTYNSPFSLNFVTCQLPPTS